MKNLVDALSSGTDEQPEQTVAEPEACCDDETDETGVFIPPLQQKIELLKKAVGVDNVYSDEECADGYEDDYEEEDGTAQLADIKRMAGISPVVIDELADDEPLES